MVAAPSSGSGKTMLTLGLLRAFRNRGLRVASAKVGPDHIDPRFHEAASGRPCLNLDPWAMKREVIASLLTDINHDADLIIVEGVMGLFDGPQGAKGSTADLAQDMGLPIVLVLDSGHQGQSIAALAEGFINHRKGLTFAGLILNRVASDKHAAILTAALAPLGVPILGLVRRSDSLNWPSRHLGLVQAQENQELELFIETTSLAVARETKLDKLLTLGAEIRPESLSGAILPPLGQRIAVADDVAFSFAYPHILQAWKKAGAEISLFSPLKDELLVIVYAQSDTRSLEVAKNILAQKSFSAFFLQGGFEAWKKNNNQTISQGDPNSFVDQSKITYLSASDLLKFLSANDPNLVILDVQSEANFARVHLKHALHIPLDQLEKRISEVPRAGIIVVYGETDLMSFQAGVRLSDLNIFSARTLSGNSNLVPTSGLPLEP